MQTDELLTIAHEAIDLAVSMMTTEQPGELTYKTDRDYASELDFRIERAVRAFLAERTPEIGFIGEEEGAIGATEQAWCLDPIDGTVNFVRGLPLCAISLGLIEGNQPVLGVIDLPRIGERYAAATGHGATLNGKPIHVSDVDNLSQAIVAIGDYATGDGSEAKNVDRLAITTQLANKVLRVRMIGTAATDLAWLAAGRIDALIMLSNKPWDVSAGIAIAREAGAIAHDHTGAEYSLEAKSLLVTTRQIATDLTCETTTGEGSKWSKV